MKKHLKQELIPPDHINTSLSAGVSEVIEVMMAKNKVDRYNNVQELLVDLEAVRNGQPPVRAHKRFDISMLEQLEEGKSLETQVGPSESEQALAKYRIGLLVLGGVSVLLLVVIIVLLATR